MASCTSLSHTDPAVPCKKDSTEIDFEIVSQYAGNSVSLRVSSLPDDPVVPESMMAMKSIENLEYDAEMKEIAFESFGNVYERKENITAQSAIKQNSGKHGSIAFVIRRPGCSFCREVALSLTILAIKHPAIIEGFNLFGVVKEFDVDNKGLLEFHDKFYPFPTYHDETLTFYSALGNNKVSIKKTMGLINPFSNVMKRIKKKKIKGNLAGEGFLKGGLIFFDADGQARYAYEEETGSDLPIDGVVAVLKAMRNS